MRGRLWTLYVLITIQGLLMILFGRMSSLPAAIVVMVFFASFSEVRIRHILSAAEFDI
jgi:NNP family nitrate/nitrite transporter-like MFS transporter